MASSVNNELSFKCIELEVASFYVLSELDWKGLGEPQET
jgi:hypothetical protein